MKTKHSGAHDYSFISPSLFCSALGLLHLRLCAAGFAGMRTGNLYALRLFVSETQARDENDSCIPHPWLGAGRIDPAHSPLLLWYLQRSDFSTSPLALRSSSPGSSLWHPRHHPCSIWTVTQVASSPHPHHCVIAR